MAASNPITTLAHLGRRGAMLTAATAATMTLLPCFASPAHADEIRDKQWHLDFLKAAQLHKITKGKGVTVAVIDSGVDGNHPDLNGNVLKGTDFTGDGDAWSDISGHGTAMASLIAGHGHGQAGRAGVLGLAPAARILPLRDHTTSEDSRGTRADKAIDQAVQEGAGVLNLSFSGDGGFSHVENALSNDAVVVAGAGNTEQGGPGIAAPAAYPGVIAVAGVDRNGNFSNKSAYGPEVVLAAPMIDIMAAGAGKRGTYGTASGTSDATAIVSGVAALIRSRYPDISANGVINRLIKTADDKGPPGRDDKYGFGVINPLKALTADIPDIDHNPLIMGANPSSSVSASASGEPPAKAGGHAESTSYLLLSLTLTAALAILAGLATYFFFHVRSNRLRRAAGAAVASSPARLPPGPQSGIASPALDASGSWSGSKPASPNAGPDQQARSTYRTQPRRLDGGPPQPDSGCDRSRGPT